MKTEDFALVVPTGKTVDQVMIRLLQAVEAKGWAVFQVYDVQERLAAKGFHQPPVKMIEICSAKAANHVLNSNRAASLCLPCRVVVYETPNGVRIAAMRPTSLSYFFPEILSASMAEAEKDITEIVNNAK